MSYISRIDENSPFQISGMYNLVEVFMSAVRVPSIINRRRIPKKAIDDVIRQIADKFKPEKIILFGSYARGNPRPESL